VCVQVSTNLESPPIMRNLRCDWASMSNRFYLVLNISKKKNGLEPEMGSGV
jgi:hypothetical protein